VTLQEQIAGDISAFFSPSGFGESATLNGADIYIVPEKVYQKEEGGFIIDMLECHMKHSDYSSIGYLADVLIYDGISWRYPKKIDTDLVSIKIEWRYNRKARVK
jgi:hypothetical protein